MRQLKELVSKQTRKKGAPETKSGSRDKSGTQKLSEKKKKKIDYKDAYKRWHSSKKAKRERAQRNKIRRHFEREGLVRPGDGKEIDHIVPMSAGGSSTRKNLRVVDRHTNRTKGSKVPKRRHKRKNASK